MRRYFAYVMCALFLVGLFPLDGHSLDRDWRKIGWERVSLPDTQDDVPWVDSVDDPVIQDGDSERQRGAISSSSQTTKDSWNFVSLRFLFSFFALSNPFHQTESNHVEANRHTRSR